MKLLRCILLALLLCTGVCCPGAEAAAQPDILVLANGDRLKGELVRKEEGYIFFRADALGLLALEETRVRRVLRAGEARPAGSQLEGSGGAPSATTAAVQADAETGASELRAENKAQKEVEEAVEEGDEALASKLEKKRTGKRETGAYRWLDSWMPAWAMRYFGLWNSRFTVGALWEEGPSDKREIDLRLQAEAIFENQEWFYFLDYEYGLRGTGANTSKSDDNYGGGVRGRFNLREHMFLQSRSSYLKDLIKGINEEFEQSVGLGWRLYETENLELNVIPALTARYQDITRDGTEWTPLSTLFLDVSYAFNERVRLEHESSVSFQAEEGEVFTYELVTQLLAALNDSLDATLRYTVSFDSNLDPGIEDTSRKLSLGLGVRF